MSTSIRRNELSIDFDLHTDGDHEFKHELVTLMIDNIKELQASFRIASSQGDSKTFRDCCHKVTPTLNILDYKPFSDLTEDIKRQTSDIGKGDEAVSFHQLCDDIIKFLENELK